MASRAAEVNAPWTEGLKAEARTILDSAANDGLDADDYRSGAVEEAFRRYLRHLHVGRVRPRDLGFGVTGAPGDGAAVDAALASAVAAGQLQNAVRALAPALAQYRQLRDALARYRLLAAAPGWAALAPISKKLEPGQPYAGVAGLRERMVVLGDLPGDATVATGHYEGALVEAVRRFQSRHGLDADGVIGRGTQAALNVPPAQRVRQIELAMERLRWLPPRSSRPVIAINIPMFRLWAWDAGAAESVPALSMEVIVGRAVRTQTPVFADEMTHLIFRPYWNVPRSILRNEVLPAALRDPGYLARHDMEIVSGPGDDAKPVAATPEAFEAARAGALRVRQRPGPKNSLGLVKFIFPNDDNVYLHGTPARELFARSRRDFSHGCVRVQNPPALAQWLLKDQSAWNAERIAAAMEGAKSQQVNLSAPVPVLLYYLTAAVSPDDGMLHFAEDIYGHDAALDRALKARRYR
ncbi:L,D-transpeptidase family protein [Piscinibacter aquaticus]|uniref:L,D-transpeptidase family protein n=1 Tax=Piscinibacter aquaticus TaxID=392597 RepID=A0A5C6TZ44_9BURK|nr:L,D-transpeptidase family protein [Piscinibacter aquaticus]